MARQDQENEQSEATPELERRSFLQGGLASAGAVFMNSVLHSPIEAAALTPQMMNNSADQIPRRLLDKTGEHVSIIGLGGYHLGRARSDLLVSPDTRVRRF